MSNMNAAVLDLDYYDVLLGLGNEESAINELSEYNGYIGDAISEIAESYTPIYHNDIWENAREVSEYIESAISEGLTDLSSGLDSVLAMGYYKYYTTVLYTNLDVFKFNYIANQLNNYLEKHNLEIDLVELDSELMLSIEDIDIDNNVSDLDDIYDNLIDRINAAEFNLED